MAPPRTAHVAIQDPIDLKPYFEHYLADKSGTVDGLTRDVEVQIHDGIRQGMQKDVTRD